MSGRRGFVLASMLVLLGIVGGPLVHAAATDVVNVDIRDYKFNPETLTIKAGTTVRWTNSEKRTSHSMQFSAAGFHSERLFPEETWEHTFDKPGNYSYVCDPHVEMKGLVIVTE